MAGTKHLVSVVAVMLGGGCYTGADGVGVDEVAQMRSTEFNNAVLNTARFNDVKFNDVKFNDVRFNGMKFNDVRFNDVRFNDVRFNDVKFNSWELEGSEFTGVVNGQTLSGEQLVGTEINITVYAKDLSNKEQAVKMTLRFDDIYLDPEAPGGDVLLYDITYHVQGSDDWRPLCENNGVSHPSIPIKNSWNETTGDRIDNDDVVTFACTDAVLGKCVQWGYRPWGEAWECPKWDTPKKCDLISLEDHHQACTRMARADYCGNGKPWTVAGTPIDIYDHLYPQIEVREENWPIEAEWGPDGAECLQDIRQQAWKQQGMYPKCTGWDWYRSKPRPDCGSLKHHRALLVSTFDK